MSLQPGALLCLFTIPFALISSLHHELARYKQPQRWRIHGVNLVTSISFAGLGLLGNGEPLGMSPPLLFLRLWLPIVYYYWAYTWAGRTLHIFYPPEFSFDRPLIAAETRWFGNPSLWMARGRPLWLNELMAFFYWSYYLYAPSLGLALYFGGDYRGFENMAMAINLGYLISYSSYPYWPLWGPRWALVSEGLLPDDEKVLPGHFFSRFMNRIMWSDTAHKGGAMPSAHSTVCIIFIVWTTRVWGAPGLLVAGTIGVGMFVSTIYGRYHYVVDVIVGVAFGLLTLWLADLIVLG